MYSEKGDGERGPVSTAQKTAEIIKLDDYRPKIFAFGDTGDADGFFHILDMEELDIAGFVNNSILVQDLVPSLAGPNETPT